MAFNLSHIRAKLLCFVFFRFLPFFVLFCFFFVYLKAAKNYTIGIVNLAFNGTALNWVKKFSSRTHRSNLRLAFFLSVGKQRAILFKRAGLQAFQLKIAFKNSELSVLDMKLDILFNHLPAIQGTRHFGKVTSVGNVLALILHWKFISTFAHNFYHGACVLM